MISCICCLCRKKIYLFGCRYWATLMLCLMSLIGDVRIKVKTNNNKLISPKAGVSATSDFVSKPPKGKDRNSYRAGESFRCSRLCCVQGEGAMSVSKALCGTSRKRFQSTGPSIRSRIVASTVSFLPTMSFPYDSQVRASNAEKSGCITGIGRSASTNNECTPFV